MVEPTAAHWTGDEWRWSRWSKPATGPRHIDVFDPPPEQIEERKERVKAGARVVPFGFGRVLEQPAVERDPLLWEGSD